MWVDIDDVRAEIRSMRKETQKEFDEEMNWHVKFAIAGVLNGYKKVDLMLDEMEEIYRKRGLENIRSLREEQQ